MSMMACDWQPLIWWPIENNGNCQRCRVILAELIVHIVMLKFSQGVLNHSHELKITRHWFIEQWYRNLCPWVSHISPLDISLLWAWRFLLFSCPHAWPWSISTKLLPSKWLRLLGVHHPQLRNYAGALSGSQGSVSTICVQHWSLGRFVFNGLEYRAVPVQGKGEMLEGGISSPVIHHNMAKTTQTSLCMVDFVAIRWCVEDLRIRSLVRSWSRLKSFVLTISNWASLLTFVCDDLRHVDSMSSQISMPTSSTAVWRKSCVLTASCSRTTSHPWDAATVGFKFGRDLSWSIIRC